MDPKIVTIPIRSDVTVRVQIPLDITRAEAEKVARVVAALAKQREAIPGSPCRPTTKD